MKLRKSESRIALGGTVLEIIALHALLLSILVLLVSCSRPISQPSSTSSFSPTINNDLFYDGFVNAEFSNGVKSVHQQYFVPIVDGNKVLPGSRIEDPMRNYRQFFDRQGRLIEFQCLDTLDEVKEKVIISYYSNGLRSKLLRCDADGIVYDSTTYEHDVHGIIRQSSRHYPEDLRAWGCDKDFHELRKTYTLASPNEIVEVSNRMCGDSLGYTTVYIFDNRSLLVKKYGVQNNIETYSEEYKYDEFGRVILLISQNNGQYNPELQTKYVSDTLVLCELIGGKLVKKQSSGWKLKIDQQGNPIQEISFDSNGLNYLMTRTIKYW